MGRSSVMDGFDVVAVGIAQEDGVVAGVVFRPFPGSVQHLHPGRHGGLVHGVDRGPVRRAEGDVQFPGLVPGRRAEPEVGTPSGPDRPTAMLSPYGKRITSRIPIAPNVRR